MLGWSGSGLLLAEDGSKGNAPQSCAVDPLLAFNLNNLGFQLAGFDLYILL